VDANILVATYFSGLYDVQDLGSADGLHLLRRVQTFLLTSPTPLQYTSECNERWIHLLACAALPLEVNVQIMATEELIQA